MRAESLLIKLDEFEPRDPCEQNELAQILLVLWGHQGMDKNLCPESYDQMRSRIDSLLRGEKHPLRRDPEDF